MRRRKMFVGTGCGILAYDCQERPDGRARFGRTLEAMPERYFQQVLVHVKERLIFAGSIRSSWRASTRDGARYPVGRSTKRSLGR